MSRTTSGMKTVGYKNIMPEMSVTNNKRITKNEIYLLFLILAFGICLRFVKARYNDGVDTDSSRYIRIAYNISCGNWHVNKNVLNEGLYMDRLVPPLYPFTIAVVNKFINNFVVSGQIVSLIPGSLNIILIFILAYIIYDPNVAMISAFLMALCFENVLYSVAIMTESLFVFFALISLIFFFYWKREKDEGENNTLFLFLSGIFMSFSFLIKPIAITISFVLTLFLIYSAYNKHIALKNVLWFLMPVSITLIINQIVRSHMLSSYQLIRTELIIVWHTLSYYYDWTRPDYMDLYNFKMLDYILSYPIKYIKYLSISYMSGLFYFFKSYLIYALIIILGFSIKKYQSSGNKTFEFIFLLLFFLFPIIPSIYIVHKRYMARMMYPLLPLFIILASKSFLNIKKALQDVLDKKIMAFVFILFVLVSNIPEHDYLYILTIGPRPIDLQHKTWMAAGEWIHNNVDSVNVSFVHDGGFRPFLHAYILRNLIPIRNVDKLIKRIKDHNLQDTQYILLVSDDDIKKMNGFINQNGANYVSVVKTFVNDYQRCVLLKLA